MSDLPPVGRGDIARRSDLEEHGCRLESRFDGAIHRELGQVRVDMLRNHRESLFVIIASQLTAVSMAFAAASF